MSELISQQWRNCQFSVVGRKLKFLLNVFLDIVPLKKADDESIYLALVMCIKDKNLQVGTIVGMGFDGAATFSGKKTGVQARLKKHAPHAGVVHCHCHLQQLACIQAANSTTGIKYVNITLTTLCKYFPYSPKRAESLNENQHVESHVSVPLYFWGTQK